MMIVDKLRKAILQSAVHGKLVPQDSNEESASILLEKIKAERAKLIKSGKIKKSKQEFGDIHKGEDGNWYETIGKATRDITDEIPFDIPNSWRWVRFGNIIELISGQDMLPDSYSHKVDDGIPYITGATNFKDGNIILNRWTQTPKVIACKGDLLLTCKGTIGEIAFLKQNKAHIARQVMSIRIVDKSNLSSNYIRYLVSFYIDRLKSQAKSMIPGISRDNVLKLPIPLPPLEEQKRIVAKLEEIKSFIDKYDQTSKELDHLNEMTKKSILQSAVQGKLVPQDSNEESASMLLEKIKAERAKLIKSGKIKKSKQEFGEIHKGEDGNWYETIGKTTKDITDEIPFDIPDSWRWVRFENIVNIISSKRIMQTDWRYAGVPFYRAREIAYLAEHDYVNNELYISEELYTKLSNDNYIPRENDLMVSAVGTIGKVYIVKKNDHFYYKDASVLCFNNFYHIQPEYIKYYMLSQCYKSQIAKNSGGTTVETLTIVRANHYLIPLPPLKEQKRIVEKIKILFRYISELKGAENE